MTTSIILDTHYFYWYVNQTPRKISEELYHKISTADNLYISAITCVEMAMLIKRQRIILSMDYLEWYKIATTHMQLKVLPVTDDIAHLSVELPEHHKDPHDRIIIATALHYGYSLASIDKKFQLYDELTDLLIIK